MRPRKKPRVVETVDRMTLISEWNYFILDQPVFVMPGDTIRHEDGQLVIARSDGTTSYVSGYVHR